jgi:two-component system response regulator AtoC
VIPIFIPPLRERPEDIGPLIDHFVKVYTEKNKRSIKGIIPEARDLLISYHWPGNVRELENALENAIVMSEGDYIQVSDLPNYLQSKLSSSPESPLVKVIKEKKDLGFRDQLDVCEREIIRQALIEAKGNKTHAAKKLGFSLRTLRNKVQKYQL